MDVPIKLVYTADNFLIMSHLVKYFVTTTHIGKTFRVDGS